MRTYDARKVAEAVAFFRKTEDGFDPIDWVSNHLNLALENSDGDMSLFEYERPGIVTGHYYFKSRGRKAIQVGQAFLDEVFNSCYNIEVIRGLVSITHLGARWISRQIGLKSYGVVKVLDQPFELFILSKKEYII